MKFLRFTMWLAVALMLILVTDQLMVHRSFDTPGLRQAQHFYRDFRTRLLTLQRQGPAGDRIGQTIATETTTPASAATRYLYVDGEGVLHFADNLQQVPAAYRKDAQPLSD